MKQISYISLLLIVLISCENHYEKNYTDSDSKRLLRIKWNENDTVYLMQYLDSINRQPMSEFVDGVFLLQDVNEKYFPVYNETYIWTEMDSSEIVMYRKFAYCATKAFIRNSKYTAKLMKSKKDTLLYNKYGSWSYTDTITLYKMASDIDSLCNELR